MPLYAFRCSGCGKEFGRFLRPAEAAPGVPCPACGVRILPEDRADAVDDPAAAPGPVCGLKRET